MSGLFGALEGPEPALCVRALGRILGGSGVVITVVVSKVAILITGYTPYLGVSEFRGAFLGSFL